MSDDLNDSVSSGSAPDNQAASSRRQFLSRLAAISAGLTLATPVARSAAAIEGTNSKGAFPRKGVEAGLMEITLNINGRAEKLNVDPRVTLLDALRDRLDLTGTKKGCDRGSCGACTVHVNGRRVLSCLTLALTAQGKKITSIEGLAKGDQLHPVQAAFVSCDGFQCGYCIPGQIMSAVGCINEGHTGSDSEIRDLCQATFAAALRIPTSLRRSK
jgi:xanthine dehydrogenase YagT iron-sulfur-binding subunit